VYDFFRTPLVWGT